MLLAFGGYRILFAGERLAFFLGNTDRVISKGVAAKIAVRSNGLNDAGTDQSMRLFVAYAAPVYYCGNGKKI